MKYIISATTSKPSTNVPPSGGGGSLTILDPNGAILSSLRSSADLSGRAGMGISSLCSFPQEFSKANNVGSGGDNTQPVIGYGGNCVKRGDNYGMLISIRSSSSPPIMHWKCRLPETEMSGGLSISPCGHYVVGGGSSGSCFVWSSIGGELLRTIKAHYRSVTSIAWSDCGRYLVTGGADGMVHLFSLMSLVDVASSSAKISKQRNVPPIHTFSVHHFPVTSLVQLAGGRIASSAEDGQVLVLELFSKKVLVNIQFPHGIQCMEHYNGRLYAGSTQGTIFSVDLDAYAMHETEKLGAIFANKRRRQEQLDTESTENWTLEEKVFGKKKTDTIKNSKGDNNNQEQGYRTDWIGHDHAVTSIALLTESEPRKMISGDSFGQIRIWELESRTCLSVVHPWSSAFANASNADDKKKSPTHPVTSLRIIAQPDVPPSSGIFHSPAGSSKNLSSFSTLVTPLQKYISDGIESANSSNACPSIAAGTIRVPFLKSNRTAQNMAYWEARPILREAKIQQQSLKEGGKSEVKEEIASMREQIKKLQEQLQAKDSEVKRWQTVNNKLMSKLQTKS
ncbi:unnamed protein product [Pseudo-nitzschia multistriata]|uniref:Anaphase-promoting complex subunit 4 WD40 domain-containing protein n=1 Tax=Pseudo-nitzschia multistriata TaxID=183589 RepID=A0A448ZKP9_9STRA|nr:unnamed protein product [Pseudo-nitzschia multistriata]